MYEYITAGCPRRHHFVWTSGKIAAKNKTSEQRICFGSSSSMMTEKHRGADVVIVLY